MINPTQIRHLKTKPGCKITKFHDGEGLYLWVYADGKKWWRFRYRRQGKEKIIALGVWPVVSLKEARELAEKHRNIHRRGLDPNIVRKAERESDAARAANSFEVIAREWWHKKMSEWSESHKSRVLISLEKDIFPWLGGRPIAEITPPEILEALRRIENRGTVETAHRIMGRCSMVFRYAVATGRCAFDPTRDLRGALKPVVSGHMAAITDPAKVGELLRAIYGYRGSLVVCSALKLSPLVFVRPGELRQAEWEDFNLAGEEWRFTASKTQQPHIVPLSRQAIEILQDIQKLTGDGRYVFPGISPDRPMSNNAVLAAFRRMGIGPDEMTGHGFRAMARTLLEEALHYPIEIIEQQLAHEVKDIHGRAYNRTKHLERRRVMMQAWADYLDKLRNDNK